MDLGGIGPGLLTTFRTRVRDKSAVSGAGLVAAVLGLELDTCECFVRDWGGTRALA